MAMILKEYTSMEKIKNRIHVFLGVKRQATDWEEMFAISNMLTN